MVGDYNAAWLHTELRDVLANGWRLAHRLAGRGMVGSWRADPPYRPFVRIDQALVSDDIDVVEVRDFDVPGSDHRGFVVSVAVR
jgi:endonuclease/exonuclease/phosphatase (EEP) superfamily protein YafD